MKLGIVGAGAIVGYTIDVFQALEMKVNALWYRVEESQIGNKLCESYCIPKGYTNYDLFLKESDIEVVYIGLINSLHYAYAKKALLAGKHVICEKPFTATGAEAKELVEIAKEQQVMIFECMMPRYAKNHESIRENLAKLGDIKMVYCNYSQYSSRYDKYKDGIVLPAFDPNFAGGALYDINVYCTQFVMDLFGRPQDVQYFANIGYNGVDTSGILYLDYDNFKAICTCAKDSNSPARALIQGTNGTIEMESMPGCVQHVNLNLNNQDGYCIDVERFDDARSDMFQKIKDIITHKEYTKSYQYIEKSVIAMEVLEKARKSAGIYFGKESR